MDDQSISHTRWKCQYHIVFIPKYRRKVMYGKVRTDVREIIKTLCRYKKVEIIEGAVCVDHVHLCVSIPLKIAISEFMGYLKGKSALMIFDKHPELGNKFKRDFWARGYYVSTIGNVDEATIRNYIKEQEEESYKESRSLK
ncbi:MAG: IS200/IS605 family transposase [Clostridiales bacterium]|nr:IS200/IS605 family transposase [Clostridiales bacterium]